MSITAAERKSADYHAGPHGSFPVNDDGGHFAAAWHLAETGHGDNPSLILEHLRHFAHQNHIPIPGETAKKAKGGDMAQLFDIAYHHESMESDPGMKRQLVRFAESHGLQQHLPDEAHGLMHNMNVSHNHPDTPNDENGMHTHEVVKAFNLTGEIVKSWGGEDGSDAYWEGWLSTPRMDKEKDITEPEAFLKPMDSYFQRRAPVSLEHDGKTLPIGHLQKAVVVRNGAILKTAVHPTDPADLEHFNGTGTGVWVRGVANELVGIQAIRKGNVGGMSFIASAPKVEKALNERGE